MSSLNIPSFKNFKVYIFQSSSHARPISFGRIVCKLCRAGETCAKTLTGFEFLWAYSSARWQALPYRRRLAALLHSISFQHFSKLSMSQYPFDIHLKKTGPVELFKQIRTNLRFLDFSQSYYSSFQNNFTAAELQRLKLVLEQNSHPFNLHSEK